MVNLPVGVEPLVPSVRGELESELRVAWLIEMDLSVSPETILHSFPSCRSMQGMSTGLRGRFGTSWSILEVNATLCPPGTFTPLVSMTDIKSVMDLQYYSSASATWWDLLLEPSFPEEISCLGWCCSMPHRPWPFHGK